MRETLPERASARLRGGAGKSPYREVAESERHEIDRGEHTLEQETLLYGCITF